MYFLDFFGILKKKYFKLLEFPDKFFCYGNFFKKKKNKK